MEILNAFNFDIKKKDSLMILTSKDEKDPLVITFTPAGFVIDGQGWSALYSSNDEICFSRNGQYMKKHRYSLPYELCFKLKKKDEAAKNIYDLVSIMETFKKSIS